MFVKKIIIFFLNLLMIKKVLSYEVIPKYGSKKVTDNFAFLDTSDFSTGDKIYISITKYDSISISSSLSYSFYESINDKSSFSANQVVQESSQSSVQKFNDFEQTFNYKIEKTDSKDNYLFMEFSFLPPVLVENTKNDKTTIYIIIFVVCFVAFVALFTTIICCICRRRRAALAVDSIYPDPIGYGVSPYMVAPGSSMQPVMNIQPIGVNYTQNPKYAYNPNAKNNQNMQYIQTSPIPQGSELRINQDAKYQKPK